MLIIFKILPRIGRELGCDLQFFDNENWITVKMAVEDHLRLVRQLFILSDMIEEDNKMDEMSKSFTKRQQIYKHGDINYGPKCSSMTGDCIRLSQCT